MTEDKATRYHRLKRRSEVAGLLWSAVCFSALLLTGAAKLLADTASTLDWRVLPARRAAGGIGPVAGVRARDAAAGVVQRLPAGTTLRPVAPGRGRLARRSSEGGWRRPAVGLWRGRWSSTCPCGGFRRRGGWSRGSRWPSWSPAWRRWPRSCCCRSSSASRRWRARHWPIGSSSWPAVPGTRVVGVYEWALGDKSRRANAALTGLGSTRRILVSDTMLADYSDDEIEVVLAHELGAPRPSRYLEGHRARVGADPAGARRSPTSCCVWRGRAWVCPRPPIWPGCRCWCWRQARCRWC